MTPNNPLTREAETRLAALAKSGDAGASSELVSVMLPFIRQRASRLHRDYPDAETADLVSVGMARVFGAITSFDPERTRWGTYAGCAAIRGMFQAARGAAIRVDRMPVDPDDYDPDQIPVLPAEPRDYELLSQLLLLLDDLHRAVLTVMFGLDGSESKTVGETARVLGLREGKCLTIYRHALLLLRLEMESRNYNPL